MGEGWRLLQWMFCRKVQSLPNWASAACLWAMGYHRLKFGITGSLSKKGGRSSVFTVYSDVFCLGRQFWLCSSRWRWRSNAHRGAWSTKWWRTSSSQEEGHGKCKGNQISLMTHDHESHEYSWIYRVSFHLCRTTGGLVIPGTLAFSHWFAPPVSRAFHNSLSAHFGALGHFGLCWWWNISSSEHSPIFGGKWGVVRWGQSMAGVCVPRVSVFGFEFGLFRC